jgi:asparagine synthetase B (glutamine-hydrolysing)
MRSWVTYLGDDLMVKVDRVLMGFSLEGRVPFLDQRVVEFGLALPDSLKVDGRHGKLMLRRWAERRLPREHAWRRKASSCRSDNGFAATFSTSWPRSCRGTVPSGVGFVPMVSLRWCVSSRREATRVAPSGG